MWNPFKKEKPINVEEQATRHLTIALSACTQALEAEERGSVAAFHLHQTALRHVVISNRLDALLDAAGVPEATERSTS